MSEEIVNKVAKSPLITLDMQELIGEEQIEIIDLKDLLFQGMILREKDLREFMKEHDWSQYEDKLVGITCSEEALIPNWAYMLLTSRLSPYAKDIFHGTQEELEDKLIREKVKALEVEAYEGKKVVVKGCSDKALTGETYLEITKKLAPVVDSLMYGEPCSTVPIYKRRKK